MSLDSSSDSSSLSSSSACFFIDFKAFSLSFLSSSSLDSLLLSSSRLLFFCFLCFLFFLCFFSFLCFLLLCLSSSLSLSSSDEDSRADFFFFFFFDESSSELSCFFEDLFLGEASSSSSDSEASFLDFFFFSVSGDEDFRLTVLFSEFSDSRFFSDECLDFFLTCFSSSLSDSSRLLLLEAFFDPSSPLSSLSLSSFFDLLSSAFPLR